MKIFCLFSYVTYTKYSFRNIYLYICLCIAGVPNVPEGAIFPGGNQALWTRLILLMGEGKFSGTQK